MVSPLTRTSVVTSSLYHHHQIQCLRNHHARIISIDVCKGVVSSFINRASSVTFLIALFVMTPYTRSGIAVDALSCVGCDKSECPNTDGCLGGLTLDICACCLVCARVENERCGGVWGSLGTCDQHLHCFIRPEDGQFITGMEEGICIGPEFLCHDNCPPAHEPKLCPPDSFLTTSEVNRRSKFSNPNTNENSNTDTIYLDNHGRSDNNYLHLPEQTSYCLCNASTCEVPVCASGYSAQLVRIATGLPGNCCNVYHCRRLEECGSVACPAYEKEKCPEDSVRILPKMAENGCCKIQQGCSCKPVDQCEPVLCPGGFQVQTISRASQLPGSCCDRFLCVKESGLTCIYNNQEFENGQTWQIDKCQMCECREGLKKCKHKACTNLSCTWMVIPDGECCPVCRGCVSDSGNLYNDSAFWQENDCTTCTCKEGQAHCQSEMCAVNCPNPETVPGQCCPVCPDNESDIVQRMCSETEECSLVCKLGLEQAAEGCFLCRCREEKCHLDCQFGLKADVEGSTICECKGAEDRCLPWEEEHCEKKCEYGYKQSKDGCMKCKCRKCPQFNCTKRCLHGHILNDEGCALCKCKEVAVPELISSNFEPENVEGRSCMTWHGSRHENGESWNDGCRLCYCHNGAEMCALIACPIPQCLNPVFRIGDCCPTCPGSTVISPTRENEMCESLQGHYYVEGETWKMDICTHCICHRGTILCETPSCPPVICHHPIKPEGQCCAMCQGTEIIPKPSRQHHHDHHRCTSPTGILYKHGEVWHSTPCQSCVCRDGHIACYNQMCPPLNCGRTVQRKGQCCLTCVESRKPMICRYNGVTYNIGEKWKGDNCTQCSCSNGQTICSHLPCPHLDCTFMIRKKNQCCPECSDHVQLHSHVPGGIGTYSDHSLLNTTALSKRKPRVDGNIVGVAVVGSLVFILAIVIFLLALYMMTHRHPVKLRPRPKSANNEPQGQVVALPELLVKTANSEKQYLEKLCQSVASEKGKGGRASNYYTELVFKDQTNDSINKIHEHLLSSKIT